MEKVTGFWSIIVEMFLHAHLSLGHMKRFMMYHHLKHWFTRLQIGIPSHIPTVLLAQKYRIMVVNHSRKMYCLNLWDHGSPLRTRDVLRAEEPHTWPYSSLSYKEETHIRAGKKLTVKDGFMQVFILRGLIGSSFSLGSLLLSKKAANAQNCWVPQAFCYLQLKNVFQKKELYSQYGLAST